ncbi:MAG TPA: hemolysin family protein [Novosphingobium sp.]|nr:hemolysin family protein [Novosphingobium sp.]
MTPFPWIDVAIIGGLVVLNGLFSMSELAIVSARPAKLRVAAEKGSQGARVALALTADPGKLLSTVQIGITLIALVTGAFSEGALSGPVAERMAAWGLHADTAEHLASVLVLGLTTFVSLVVGELVPKQLALIHAETIAGVAAQPMAVMARVMAPLVWLLDKSSRALLRLFGGAETDEKQVTEEEVHMIIAEAHRHGVIEEDERAIMTGIMRLADRPVRELMTPRTDMDWIERDASEADIRAEIRETPHSLLPVADGSPDAIIGVVKVREVLAALIVGGPLDIEPLIRKAAVVPDQLDAMDALKVLQQSDVSMALVHDEYGHLEGIVTPADLLSAIAGTFVSHQDEGEGPMVVEREDGSLLISGALPADALIDRLGVELPESRDYATVAGYALSVLKRLPKEGEAFADQGWRWEVVDMDRRKIDKLLVSRVPVPAEADER